MVADTSLYSLLKMPAPQEGPLDQFGKMISIKSLMGNEQLNEMQRTKLARDMQEEEQFRGLFAGATPDSMSAPDFIQKAMAASPTRGIALNKTMLEQKKTQAELGKLELEAQAAKAKDARDSLAGVTDQASYDAWRQYGTGKGYQVAAQAPAVFDPTWQKQHLLTADKFIEQMNQDRSAGETSRHHKATEGQAGAALAETRRHHGVTEQYMATPDLADPVVNQQIDYWADVLRKGGSLPPGLARSGSGFVKEVTKRAAMGPGAPEDMMANQARFTGEKAGQRTLGTRTANIEMAATEAASLADLAKQASAKVDRTSYKSLNDAIQAGQRATASPELRAFTASNTSLINAYARAINPQGVGTVADKEHAREMLSTAFSKGDYEAAINQLMLEIDAARKSPGTVQKEMRDRFTGVKADGAGAPAAKPTNASDASAKGSGGIRFLGFE